MFNDEPDNVVIAQALSMWANYIETGEVTMSAQDAYNQGEQFKALTTEQMKFVVRLRELETEVRDIG